MSEEKKTGNPLARKYTLWYSGASETRDAESFKDSIKPLATFSTVEEFWSVYQHILRPDKVNPRTCYHLFQEGIEPMWEDPANKEGGRWYAWFQKGYSNRLWEDLLLAIIGNQFEKGDMITGIEVRTRVKGDTISVWTKNSADEEEKESVKQDFLKALNAPEGLHLDYEVFSQAMSSDHKKPKKSHWKDSKKGNYRN